MQTEGVHCTILFVHTNHTITSMVFAVLGRLRRKFSFGLEHGLLSPLGLFLPVIHSEFGLLEETASRLPTVMAEELFGLCYDWTNVLRS
jgi:hypothetical protein